MNAPDNHSEREFQCDVQVQAPEVSLCADGPSLNDLAAFVDDRLGADEKQLIEAHLALCEICREACDDIRAAREQEADAMVFVPPHVISSAMGLVKPGRSSWSWRFGSRIAAAAAAVAISLSGYWVGTSISPADAQGESLDTAMSFGLIDSASDGSGVDSDLLAMALTQEEAVQ